MCLFFTLVSRFFSLSSDLNIFTVICLFVDLLVFIIFGVCWTSSMYRLLFSSINLDVFQNYFFWNIFSTPFSIFFHSGTSLCIYWFSGIPNISEMFIFLHSFFSLLFRLYHLHACRFFLPPVQMYPPACLVSFHFSYYTFQFPNDRCLCYIISEFLLIQSP